MSTGHLLRPCGSKTSISDGDTIYHNFSWCHSPFPILRSSGQLSWALRFQVCGDWKDVRIGPQSSLNHSLQPSQACCDVLCYLGFFRTQETETNSRHWSKRVNMIRKSHVSKKHMSGMQFGLRRGSKSWTEKLQEARQRALFISYLCVSVGLCL